MSIELTSCRKMLPPTDKETVYLIQTNNGYFCSARWTNNRFGIGESGTWGWSIMDIPQYSKVVAWGPLPTLIIDEGDEIQ